MNYKMAHYLLRNKNLHQHFIVAAIPYINTNGLEEDQHITGEMALDIMWNNEQSNTARILKELEPQKVNPGDLYVVTVRAVMEEQVRMLLMGEHVQFPPPIYDAPPKDDTGNPFETPIGLFLGVIASFMILTLVIG